ncbi:esterase [Advenella kashmirensis W13003]|uniref:Esterase n=1 Tax=Advenella kashmirensis W13003 TaxID=1424334 RepID=V8QXE2_9BURK|nr:alpha/beta fold hydrolase [Advenella kashmirensis]ETF03689.1 esterase [Advenella kashmirensis W13003]
MKKSHSPISLRDMGSFHVGGRTVQLHGQPEYHRVLSAGGEPVSVNLNGTYMIEQMYVQYFLPAQPNGKGPLIFWHGGGMSGAAWETTPDGREGWANFFIHRGWDVYLCDAVERGRSGFAPVPEIWPEKPVVQTVDDIYSRFRIGDRVGSYDHDPSRRSAYPNTRFPLNAFDQFTKQMVPRWTHTNEAMIAAFEALLEKVGTASLLCHSQAGPLALQLAARNPDQLRALVAIEPAGIPQIQFDELRTPALIVLGDNIETDNRWRLLREKILQFAATVNSAEVLSLPAIGITGNSHVMMMDTNNQQIAQLIDAWMTRIIDG